MGMQGLARWGVPSNWIKGIQVFFLVMGWWAPILEAQDTVWVKPLYLNKGSWMVGTDFGGGGVTAVNQTTGQPVRASIFQFDPKIAIFPSRWFCIGAQGTIGLVRGNVISHYNYHGLGGFGRLYPFANLQQRIMRGDDMQFLGIPTFQLLRARDRDLLAQHVFPFIETSVTWEDLRNQKNGAPIKLGSLSEMRVLPALGVDFRIWKGLSIALAFVVPIYPENPDVTVGSPGIRFGVEWFFRKKVE